MIIECTRGFGEVEHPETGEAINVEEPFETDEETFELLSEAYPGFEIVEDEPDEITCAEGDCSRNVSEEGEYCWQHPADE